MEKLNLNKYLNNDEYNIELVINKSTPLTEYLKKRYKLRVFRKIIYKFK